MKLLESLRLAAIDVPTWHLTNEWRWRLLRDTLLGHVRVRGAIRPRDLPLDPSCQSVLDAASDILDLPAYEAERGQLILFRHWFAAFTALQLSPPTCGHRPALTSEELLTATILEIVFATNKRVLQKAADIATLPVVPVVHRLIGILGLSQQEWTRLVSEYFVALRPLSSNSSDQPKKVSDPHDALLARTAALVTALESPPLAKDHTDQDSWHDALAVRLTENLGMKETAERGKRESIRRSLVALGRRKCCIVTLKVHRPQRYINRGKRHWLLRGASGWCSQSLALARDFLCDLYDGKSLLFSDSDAVVGMWFPAHATQANLRRELDEKVDESVRLAPKEGDIVQRFPRLTKWLADNLPNGVHLDRSVTLPPLSLKCLEPMSVLNMCVYRIPPKDKCARDEAATPAIEGTCSRVLEDQAVAFPSTPPWLGDQDDGDEAAVGITSVIWALCGTAFRTHAHEGLCKSFERLDASRLCSEAPIRPSPDTLVLQEVHHGKWLGQLRMPDESLVHLKMDGDGVGKMFCRSAVADFPWLSMQLARIVQRRLVAGVRAAVASCNVVGQPPVPTLPVDVVYVGGDDVYVIMPLQVLDAFLQGFAASDPDLATNPWKDTCFSFVAAMLKPKKVLLENVPRPETTRRLAAANLAAARLVTEGLDRVKDDFKGEAVLDPRKLLNVVNDALRKSGLADHEMQIAIEEEPLLYGSTFGGGRHNLRGRVIHVGPPTRDT